MTINHFLKKLSFLFQLTQNAIEVKIFHPFAADPIEPTQGPLFVPVPQFENHIKQNHA